jgi:acyl-CoA dehydrogenase
MKDKTAGQSHIRPSAAWSPIRPEQSYTIFEGTSEIQRLVISRATSGMRIR